MVNKGRIGPDRILFVKSTEVKMYPVYWILRYTCITLVWFGSEFLRAKQVTLGNPGIKPLVVLLL